MALDSLSSTLPRFSIRSGAARVALLGLFVFAVLAITHRTFLFIEPWHEHSDYAVNAIAIERAHKFQTIHGNYSRFGFYHPGPAFYYVYALGEQVFYRGLNLVPSRYNAHALAGLILQSFFLAAALAIAQQWIRRLLFVPLALATMAIHFSLAGNAFIDTWPPRVLLAPFLCFLVGAASLACGRWGHLPVTVLAGCFLVHGHVAQPLYVVPLFLLAGGFAWQHARRGGVDGRTLLRTHRASFLASAGCIALFLVPFAIDLSDGSRSNLVRIFEFETSYHGPGKPLWKALLYFCAFFGYVKKTEAFLSVTGPDRASAIGEHVSGYFIWGAIIVAVLIRAWRVWRHSAAPDRPFVLSLTGFTALAFLLSLRWGMVQIGPMYEYNGYFFYAILGCILVLLCAAISTARVPKPAIAAALLCVAAAAIAWQRQYAPLAIDYSTNRIPPAVEQALQADPLPAAPKYLLFHGGDWGEAVSVGLALMRAGHEFRADLDWGPKFTPNGGFEPVPPDFDLQGMSTWRLSRIGPPDVGSPLRDNLRIYFKPLPLDPSTAVIDGGENGNLELYTLFGFTSPVGSTTWTIRPYAGLVFETPPVSSNVSVTFFAEPFSAPGEPANQPMTLSVNGRPVFTGTLTAKGSVTARVPAEIWNAKQPALMTLHFPAAVAPSGAVRTRSRDLGGMLDQRMFGWRIERIVFEPVR